MTSTSTSTTHKMYVRRKMPRLPEPIFKKIARRILSAWDARPRPCQVCKIRSLHEHYYEISSGVICEVCLQKHGLVGDICYEPHLPKWLR